MSDGSYSKQLASLLQYNKEYAPVTRMTPINKDLRPLAQYRMNHTGFWMNVDGTTVHVNGDPNMSDETAETLANVVRAAAKMMEEKASKK